jgi:pyruvate/2-oxoacid:ferredoxin oxidoreductase beta subunit
MYRLVRQWYMNIALIENALDNLVVLATDGPLSRWVENTCKNWSQGNFKREIAWN